MRTTLHLSIYRTICLKFRKYYYDRRPRTVPVPTATVLAFYNMNIKHNVCKYIYINIDSDGSLIRPGLSVVGFFLTIHTRFCNEKDGRDGRNEQLKGWLNVLFTGK